MSNLQARARRYLTRLPLVLMLAGGVIVGSAGSAHASAACFYPRHWVYRATGYNPVTGTAFGHLVCEL